MNQVARLWAAVETAMEHATRGRAHIAGRTRALLFSGAALVVPVLAGGCDDDRLSGEPGGGTTTSVADRHVPGDAHDQQESGHSDEVRLTPDAIERHGVRIEEAQLWILRPTLTCPARVAFNAEAMAHVGSPVGGRAVEIRVRLGDVVQAGDELVVVESPELGEAQAEYLQKRLAVEMATPAVEQARVAWERARGLHEQSQSISLTEVQKREVEHKAAAMSLRAAEAAVIGAESHLRILGIGREAIESLAASGEIDPRYTIRAPIAGRVVEREVTLGELVGPEREALLVVADTSVLWVIAEVPEARVREVPVGARAWVRVGGPGGDTREATVAFVGPTVDPATRTAQARLEVAAEGLGLAPGMFVQVEVVAQAASGAEPAPQVAVPEEAVQTVGGASCVFVPAAGQRDTFVKRPVGVGPAIGGLVPVSWGLAEGERFVAAGAFILKAELGKAGAEHSH
jgi:membrane fusion protein, heavy metal efflux system